MQCYCFGIQSRVPFLLFFFFLFFSRMSEEFLVRLLKLHCTSWQTHHVIAIANAIGVGKKKCEEFLHRMITVYLGFYSQKIPIVLVKSTYNLAACLTRLYCENNPFHCTKLFKWVMTRIYLSVSDFQSYFLFLLVSVQGWLHTNASQSSLYIPISNKNHRTSLLRI